MFVTTFLFIFFTCTKSQYLTIVYCIYHYLYVFNFLFLHYPFFFFFFFFYSFFFSFTFRNISLHPFSNILIFLLTFTVCSCRIQHLASIRELVDLILLNDFTSYICFALASAFRNTPVSLFICY